MGVPGVTQAVVVSGSSQIRGQESLQLALFNADGTAFHIPEQAAAQANFAGADVTALKVELNAFLTKLRDANIIAT